MIKKFLKENSIHKKIVPYLDIFFVLSPISFFVTWILVCIGMYLDTFFPILFLQETTLYITQFNINTLFLFFGMSILLSSMNSNLLIVDPPSVIHSKNEEWPLITANFNIGWNDSDIRKNFCIIISFLFLFISSFKVFVIGVILYLVYRIREICIGPYNSVFGPDVETLDVHIYIKILFNTIIYFLIICIGFIYSYDNSFAMIVSYKFLILVLPYILCFVGVNFIYESSFVKKNNNIVNNVINSKSSFSNSKNKSFIFLANFLMLFSLIISLCLKDPLLSTSIIVFFPFFLYALFRNLEKDIIRTITYPLAILSFFMMIIYPYLFLVELILFYLCKYYYWHRFNTHFPKFIIDD